MQFAADETPQDPEVTQASPAENADAVPAAPLVPADDIAALGRVFAHDYTDPERELMRAGLTETRAELLALRAETLPPDIAPAFYFEPRPVGWTPLPGADEVQFAPVSPVSFSDTPDGWDAIAFASVAQLGDLVRRRIVTSLQLTRFFLDRLKRLNELLNCVVTFTDERALRYAEQADREITEGKYRGPLHGIPYGAKDLFAVRDCPTTWGAEPYRTQTFDYNATVITRLDEAGAILIAKLTLGELAMDDVWFGGQTVCPWNRERGASGSSAGSGAAVAAGGVPFALGTETLGSIVSPSARNAVTGLRPTFGRIPRTGAMPLCWTLDKVGPMCRTVNDCALVFAALHGPDGQDATVRAAPLRYDARAPLAGLRVGLDIRAWEAMEKDADRKPVYDAALATLRGLEVEPVPVMLPEPTPAYTALAGIIIGVEGAASFQELNHSGGFARLARQGTHNWPNLLRIGSTIPASDYVQAMRLRTRLCRDMADALNGLDVVVTVPLTGPGIYYTNLCGHPSLVTRCGVAKAPGEVPPSIEFWGQLDGEADILRLASAFEAALALPDEWPRL